jgi:hypothetical protein
VALKVVTNAAPSKAAIMG